MPNINLSILNQKATPAFFADTLANRPAPSFVGRIFISTDTYDLYRDTGSAWDLLSPSAAAGVTGTGVANQVAFWSGTTAITGDNNLWWDNVNGHLGVNTNTPGTALDVHHDQPTIAILNQTNATNDARLGFQNNGVGLWRIGAFYNAGANDFAIFDAVNSLERFSVKNTGQTFVGAQTTSSGKFVVNSASGDNHIVVIGATAPSFRINNAGTGATQQIGIGLATTTNNFIQGTTGGEMAIFNSNTTASPILFGIYNGTNTQEAARISAARNFLIGQTADTGQTLQVTGSAAITGITQFSNTGAFVGFPGVTINQGSGTGIALSITKAGNNEGLYVNKTSGTGNAVTIIGTLNATTLVKSGGTSAQILAADGSVITAGTGITISGGTISASGGSGITGGGTINTIPLYTGSTNIGNSVITQSSGLIRIGAFYGSNQSLSVNGNIDTAGVLMNNGVQIINVASGTLAIGDGTGKLNTSDIVIDTATFTIDIGNAFAPYTLNNYGPITASNILSGTYTPNVISSTNMSVGFPFFPSPLRYTRVGNVVNVTGQIYVNTGGGNSSCIIDVPIGTSVFSGPGELSGTGIGAQTFNAAVMYAYFMGSGAELNITFQSPSGVGEPFAIDFSYIIP